MSDPALDEEEKPLDPAAQRIEQRIRKLMLVAGLTLAIGFVSVFGAILYRVMSSGDSPSAPEVAQPADSSAVFADAESAIRSALSAWNAAVNAGDAEAACALYAPDLRSQVGSEPEQNFEAHCAALRQALADDAVTLAYALDVREIILSGDMAVVRRIWTRTERPAAGAATTVQEPGMDVFRRQADGSWKISRSFGL